MVLSADTKAALEKYLTDATLKYIKDAPVELSKPYHESLLPWIDWAPVSEHSFATRSGAWFEMMAELVARQFNTDVARQYLVKGRIRNNAKVQIDVIVAGLERPSATRTRPHRTEDIRAVLERQSDGGEDTEWTSDFYVKRRDGRELFFELKTPQPNKSHCERIKRGILTIAAMKKGQDAEAFGGFAYNPYNRTGDTSPYTWGYARQYLEIGRDVLIGKAFWAAIGEPTTFDEVWALARKVGQTVEADARKILGDRLGARTRPA